MNIFIYSDESGVFDNKHYKYYVYGGVIAIDNIQNIAYTNKYSNIEKSIRNNSKIDTNQELKASFLNKMTREHFFRSLKNYNKFATIIDLEKVLPQIFENKKSKQRFLDYAYKRTVKNALKDLLAKNNLSLQDIEYLHFYIDEHTTATDGYYELRESMLNEFKIGNFNFDHMSFFPPICKNLKDLQVNYCDSKRKTLIRASGIIANRVYYLINNEPDKLNNISNINITRLP